MKYTFVCLLAVTSAITVAPVPNNALAQARKYKDSEKDQTMGSTMDSLQQAEKELGMKLDTP